MALGEPHQHRAVRAVPSTRSVMSRSTFCVKQAVRCRRARGAAFNRIAAVLQPLPKHVQHFRIVLDEQHRRPSGRPCASHHPSRLRVKQEMARENGVT